MSELKQGQMVTTTNPLVAGLGLGFVQKATGNKVKVEFRPSVFSWPSHETKVAVLDRAEVQPIRTLWKGSKSPSSRSHGGLS